MKKEIQLKSSNPEESAALTSSFRTRMVAAKVEELQRLNEDPNKILAYGIVENLEQFKNHQGVKIRMNQKHKDIQRFLFTADLQPEIIESICQEENTKDLAISLDSDNPVLKV